MMEDQYIDAIMMMVWDTAESIHTDDLVAQAEYINRCYGTLLHLEEANGQEY